MGMSVRSISRPRQFDIRVRFDGGCCRRGEFHGVDVKEKIDNYPVG